MLCMIYYRKIWVFDAYCLDIFLLFYKFHMGFVLNKEDRFLNTFL